MTTERGQTDLVVTSGLTSADVRLTSVDVRLTSGLKSPDEADEAVGSITRLRFVEVE
jgi:hypothetical protein